MEWICGNGVAKIGGKKNLLQLVCGNDIAEIEGEKKRVAIDLKKKKFGLWQWHCHNYHKSLLFLQ